MARPAKRASRAAASPDVERSSGTRRTRAKKAEAVSARVAWFDQVTGKGAVQVGSKTMPLDVSKVKLLNKGYVVITEGRPASVRVGANENLQAIELL